jgi:hypothetical protein
MSVVTDRASRNIVILLRSMFAVMPDEVDVSQEALQLRRIICDTDK